MKNIFLALLFSISPFAHATSLEVEATLEDLDLKYYLQTNSRSKDYVWKSSISCNTKGTGKDILYPTLKAVSYYVCPDKTISHIQPESAGYNGWEGYCGQTAISNVTSMLCDRHMSPKSNDFYGKDSTPGQHSSTMKKSLRKIFSEYPEQNSCPKVTWNTRASWSGSEFLKSVKNDLFGSTKKVRRYRNATTYVDVTPTPVLLNSGGFNYHWVTVVDIIKNKNDDHGCDVVVNTWGDQKTLTCTNFVNYGDHSGLGEHMSLGFDK